MLVRHYGQTQVRCSELVRSQCKEIEALRGQVVRLRAAVVIRNMALAWECEQPAVLEATILGLPTSGSCRVAATSGSVGAAAIKPLMVVDFACQLSGNPWHGMAEQAKPPRMMSKSPNNNGRRPGLQDIVVEIEDPELQALIQDPQVAEFLSAYLSISDPALRLTLRSLVEEVLQKQQPEKTTPSSSKSSAQQPRN